MQIVRVRIAVLKGDGRVVVLDVVITAPYTPTSTAGTLRATSQTCRLFPTTLSAITQTRRLSLVKTPTLFPRKNNFATKNTAKVLVAMLVKPIIKAVPVYLVTPFFAYLQRSMHTP